MTKTVWLASTAIVAAALLTAPAHAGGTTKENARDQEIQELKARLDRLEREAEDEKIQTGSRLNKVEETQNAVQWTFNDRRPTIRSGDGRFEMSIRGRVQLDWALFDQDQSDFGAGYGAVGSCAATNALCDLGSGGVSRRLPFAVEGRFFRDFIYEIRLDFGGTDIEGAGIINVARVGYVGVPGLRVQAGALQPILTMYDATSSAELTTMERAAVVTTLVGNFGGDNGRRGVEVTYQKEGLLYDGDNFLISRLRAGLPRQGRPHPLRPLLQGRLGNPCVSGRGHQSTPIDAARMCAADGFSGFVQDFSFGYESLQQFGNSVVVDVIRHVAKLMQPGLNADILEPELPLRYATA